MVTLITEEILALPKKKINGIIYKYTNKINGKVYIGLTIHERARQREHKYLGAKGNSNLYFYNAIHKYGWENFEYEVLKKIDFHTQCREDGTYWLDYFETLYIQKYDSTNPKKGYNLTKGGRGHTGYKLPKEMIEKRMSKIRGRKHSEISRQHFSEAQRKAVALRSDSWYDKMRNTVCKSIILYDLNGNYIKEWKGSIYASKELGISNPNIVRCAKGRSRSAGGYKWVYKDNISSEITSDDNNEVKVDLSKIFLNN